MIEFFDYEQRSQPNGILIKKYSLLMKIAQTYSQCLQCLISLKNMKDYTIAKVKANLLLNEFCVESPSELDLVGIANAKGAVINYAPLSGHMGRIYHDGKNAIIKVNSKVSDAGQRNFIISHELGHFLTDDISKHNCDSTDLLSYTSKNETENKANVFAAELLMNSKWFKEFTEKKLFNKFLLEEIANYFKTSITSAAIRYTQSGYYPIAIVLTQNGFTKWAAFSKEFPFQYISNNVRVNSLSTVYDYYKIGKKFLGPEEIRSEAWFEDAYEAGKPDYLIEENIYMKNYESVLTILRLMDLAD